MALTPFYLSLIFQAEEVALALQNELVAAAAALGTREERDLAAVALTYLCASPTFQDQGVPRTSYSPPRHGVVALWWWWWLKGFCRYFRDIWPACQ